MPVGAVAPARVLCYAHALVLLALLRGTDAEGWFSPREFNYARDPTLRASVTAQTSGKTCERARVPLLFDPFPKSVSHQLRFPVTNLTAQMHSYLTAGAHSNMGMLQLSMSGSVAGRLARTQAQASHHPCNETVPRLLHYIWLGSTIRPNHARGIAATLELNAGWRAYIWVDRPVPTPHRNAEVKLWDDVRSNFANKDLIEEERNLAGKSDYMRMEVVYMHGGVYLDTDAVALQPFDKYGDLFKWPFVSPETKIGYKNICNCAFSGVRHSPFLRFAISATRQNCKLFKYCGVMSGAGPGFLTGALLAYRPSNYVLIDQQYLLTGRNRENAVMYQRFEGNWL